MESPAETSFPALYVGIGRPSRLVGEIVRRSAQAPLFRYQEEVGLQDGISLSMPPGRGAYAAPRPGSVHPVFDTNLPEGEMRAVLERTYARHFPVFDDCALLGIVGRSMIGRLYVWPVANEKSSPPPPLALRDLLSARDTRGLFATLLDRYAAYSGVSGVQPKFLVRDVTTELAHEPGMPGISTSPTARRVTVPGATHIVKTADLTRYPGMVANEFLALALARKAGLKTASASLSDDGALLAVERFDTVGENYLGFEDFCALAGLRSHQKYEGSYEQVAKSIRLATGPLARANLTEFFRAITFSIAIRNGDAHRKNFGILYADTVSPARLAPCYDVLTTRPYISEDLMGLTIDGTKRWPERKRLLRFGQGSCGLSPSEAGSILAEVSDAVAHGADEWLEADGFEQATKHLPTELRSSLAAIWREGARGLGPSRAFAVSPLPVPSRVGGPIL